MSMVAPIARLRAAPFSDAWWSRWREVHAIAVYNGNSKKIRRLRTAATIGMVYYLTQEVTAAATDKIREYARFAGSIIAA